MVKVKTLFVKFQRYFLLPMIGLILMGFLSEVAPAANKELGNLGVFSTWAKIEISMTGPGSVGTGTPNPFAIFVDVIFTGPSGQTYEVPGFYDGNGEGHLNGNVWKTRFSADEEGTWMFISSSPNSQLDGYTGTFDIVSPPTSAHDFYRWGRLEYVGTAQNKLRYLKFSDGPYWLKAGCDDPENFLGDFSNYNTLTKRKVVVDYLASKGVNSMYIMTHNIDGDGQDVWPWLGNTTSEAKSHGGSNARFDIVKLEEWRELFEYMQTRGVVPYLVLEDDSAWTGYDHVRYYRELIARLGYLPALLFNFGEEYNENYGLSEALVYMQQFKDIDPYDHPRGIHNVNSPTSEYLDASQVDFTAIQTKFGDALAHNQRTIDWINLSKTGNQRVLMVGFDEPRPLMDRKGWWSTYMAGGVWEVHVDKPYDRPMSTWETAFEQIGGARTFMESLPFWEMEPSNELVKAGTAYGLAKPGVAYALYLPSGGTVQVALTEGATYNYAWWKASNDRNGNFQNEGSVSGGEQFFTAPSSGDWVLRIVTTSMQLDTTPPVAPTNLKFGLK